MNLFKRIEHAIEKGLQIMSDLLKKWEDDISKIHQDDGLTSEEMTAKVMETVQPLLDAHTAEITKVQDTVTDQTAAITQAQTDLKAAQDRIADLETAVTDALDKLNPAPVGDAAPAPDVTGAAATLSAVTPAE